MLLRSTGRGEPRANVYNVPKLVYITPLHGLLIDVETTSFFYTENPTVDAQYV
jgi:hypothetical protein